MNSLVDWSCRLLASSFFLTYPLESFAQRRGWKWTGTGFIGSLVGVACARFLPTDPMRCLLSLAGAVLFSVVISDIAEKSLGVKDDHRIVIDEWAGYLVTVALLPQTPLYLGLGFVVFRALDTVKPLGIRSLGRLPGGWGVVLDDIAAGILGNAILHFVRWVM